MKRGGVITLLVFGFCVQAQTSTRSVFSDVPPGKEAFLSRAVLDALVKQPETSWFWEAHPEERQDARRYFRAVEVELCSPGERDFVVRGVSPLTGGDQGWFWILRSAQSGPQVIFVPGSEVELLNQRTLGCRDIRSNWHSASTSITRVFKFDGHRYRKVEDRIVNPGSSTN